MNKIKTKQQKIKLLESAFGESSLANSGKNISVVCPACKDNSKTSSKKKKLSVCLEKGIYHCWVCESKGKNVASFANYHGSISQNIYAEIIQVFDLDTELDTQDEKKEIFTPSDFSLLFTDNTRNGMIAKRYLRKRGLTLDDLLRFKIGISNEKDYINRIIIPSFSEDMKLNFFLSRTYDKNQKIKYKNCDSKKSEIIFNEYLIDWGQEVVLVEGVFDAIKSTSNTVPVLGSWIDHNHKIFQKVVQEKSSVVLAFDPDAIHKTEKIAKNFSEYGINVKVTQNKDKDLGDMTKEEAFNYIKSAKKYEISNRLTYLIENISSGSIF